MKFKTYDILSSLISGVLILIPCLNFLGISYNKDYILFYTAVSFFLGYIINTIGSWAEFIYNWTWRGKPSDRLLDGNFIWKVKLYEYKNIKKSLLLEISEENPSNDKLFSIAMRKTVDSKNTRIQDFNAMYAFSRSILTTTIIASIFILVNNPSNILYYIISIVLIIIVWQRSKERGYYFAKEVLNQYYTDKNKKDKI